VPENITLVGPGVRGAPPPDEQPEPPVAHGSIVARLRANAKAQQQAKHVDIAVGGEFEDRLWIRYRPLPPAAMDRFVAARAGLELKDVSATSATMDMMAQACECVIGKDGDDEEVLEDDNGPVLLEDRLARLLDLRSPSEPVLSSYDVITRLFGSNGAMIAGHGDQLATWMTNPTTSIEEMDAGES